MGARRSLSVTTRAPLSSSGPRASDSGSPRPAACRYGGSQRTREYVSPRSTCVTEGRGDVAAAQLDLRLRRARARRGWPSTPPPRGRRLDEHGALGPARERLDAQRARSRVEVEHAAPSSGPRMLNSASRTRSDVGRVPRPGGAVRRRPPNRPATTLSRSSPGRSSSRPRRRRRALPPVFCWTWSWAVCPRASFDDGRDARRRRREARRGRDAWCRTRTRRRPRTPICREPRRR